MKQVQHLLQKYHKDRFIWCLITMAFCWNDIGEYHHMAINKQLVVWLAVSVFLWYKLKLFKTWKTGTTIVPMLAGVVLTVLFLQKNVFPQYFFYNYTIGINLIFWLPLVANLVKRMLQEKRFFKLNASELLLLLMCLVMQISVNENKYGFLMMGLLIFPVFLCPMDEEEKSDMLKGIVDGFCMGFLLAQAYAFGFRHYQEEGGRYKFYRDYCTFAGQSYLNFFIAWMIKYLSYAGEKQARWKRNICWWMCAFVTALMYLTGGKSSVVGVIGVTAVVMLIRHVKKWNVKNVGRWALGCAALGVTSLLLFPVAYASVRYLPTIIGHPDYLDSESNRLYSFNTRVLKQTFLYNEEYTAYCIKVGDPADSVKYITFSECVADVLGRFVPGGLIPQGVYEEAFADKLERADYYIANEWISERERIEFLNNYSNVYFGHPYVKSQEAVQEEAAPEIAVAADVSENGSDVKQETLGEAKETIESLRGETVDFPWFADGVSYSASDERNAIHAYTLQHMNLVGHEQHSFLMYLTPGQIIGHAHNIFLIIGYDHGILAVLCMILFMGASAVLAVRKWRETRQAVYVFPLCLVLGMTLYGIWESGFRSDNAFSIFLFMTAACLGTEKRREIKCGEEENEKEADKAMAGQ